MPVNPKPQEAALKSRKLFYISLILLATSCALLGLALRAEYRAALLRPAESRAPFSLGHDITSGDATMSLSNPTYADGTGMFAAPEGKHYLIVDFSVKNISDKSINVMPASDTYVKAADGTLSYLTPYTLKSPLRAGELPAGDVIKGQLSFLVAKSQPVKFYVDSIWSGRVVQIDTK
jgi:hypothetical protein